MDKNHEPITNKQIGKIQDLLGAALRKTKLLNGSVQLVIEHQGKELITELVEVIGKWATNDLSDFFTVTVTVDRTRNPQEVLNAPGRKQCNINQDVANNMPRGKGEKTEMVFFWSGGGSFSDMEKEYQIRRLRPADPYSLLAVDEKDPVFLSNSISTIWRTTEDWSGCGILAINRFTALIDAKSGIDVYDWRGSVVSCWLAGFSK